MKHVRLIRHGESDANVGTDNLDHAIIPFTCSLADLLKQPDVIHRR